MHDVHADLIQPARPASLSRRSLVLSYTLAVLAACAEVPAADDSPGADAATAAPDAGGSPSGSPSGGDAGIASSPGFTPTTATGGSTVKPAAPSTPATGTASAMPDASTGSGLEGIVTNLGNLFTANDAGVRQVSPDAGSSPPPEGGGKWTLNADSADECPDEPPPIPIIGGACLGIYYGCGWTNESKQTYSCVCDWVHWLCI
ncbi:MAG: hypothetical protein RL385_3394 [Pseudomonadota bacterium]|jgi:hypothetical protein